MHDVFFHHAVIHDGERFRNADALLVRDGRIAWIGRAGEAPACTGVPSVDLAGRTILPAFCDVHTHPSWIAATVKAVPCVSPIVNTIDEMIDALRRHPNAGKGADAWITGFGYDEGKLAEHRTPTLENLDRASSSQPVFVKRSDCHSAVCNSVALKLAGISADSPDPAGGRFGRFEDGRPNGVLIEFSAAQAVERLMGAPTFESEVEMMVASGEHFLARGILAFTEMMADYRQLSVYREASRRGFPVRAGLYLVWKGGRDPEGMPPLSDADRTGDHFIAGVKLFADGSVSGATAAVTSPYLNGSTGMVTLDDEALSAAAEYARVNRVQLSVHAMGDRAVERIIERFEHEPPWLHDRPSVRIEHATFLNARQIARMNASPMNFGVTTQVIFPYAEIEGYRAVLATRDLERVYPVKTASAMMEAFALSSDAPATAWADPDDPFVSMGAAVSRTAWDGTRFNASEGVTNEEALALYTSRPMRVLPFEGSGRLDCGMRADFIVLRNPLSFSSGSLADNSVLELYREGALLYRAPAKIEDI